MTAKNSGAKALIQKRLSDECVSRPGSSIGYSIATNGRLAVRFSVMETPKRLRKNWGIK